MDRPFLYNRAPSPLQPVEAESILNALSAAILVVDEGCSIVFLNGGAEQFLGSSAGQVQGQSLLQYFPGDSPIFALIDQARAEGHAVAEYHVTLSSPRIGHHVVNVRATPLSDTSPAIVISLQERSVAAKIERQLLHQGKARSVGAMAAMLAHEVKNPLSGIRGAAQLLEDSVSPEDRALTRLIREEADRICALVDRMEVFSTGGGLQLEPVNIHEVLNRVRILAENGFGADVRFIEEYDPSLPPVLGHKDHLIQAFLNLVKNAVEAAKQEGSEVILATAYWHGVRFAVSRQRSRVHLPLMVRIQDNGPGIPEDIKPHMFEPFVTAKPRGSGLGLALVAKIIEDHGGVIEVESEPKRTVFRIMLPMHTPSEDGK